MDPVPDLIIIIMIIIIIIIIIIITLFVSNSYWQARVPTPQFDNQWIMELLLPLM